MLPVSGSTAGDAHDERCCGTSLRYRLKRRSHTIFPVSASSATRRPCVLAGSPGGDPFDGRLVSADRPSRDGPRHSGKSLAPVTAPVLAARRAAPTTRLRILVVMGS